MKLPVILLICSSIVAVSGILTIPFFCSLIPVGALLNHYAINNFTLLGNIGILLLFFSIGLELSLEELKHLSSHILPAVFLNAGLVTIITALCYIALPLRSSIILAILLSLSSTPLILTFLKDQQQTSNSLGYSAVAVILIQDFMSMMLLIYIDNYYKSAIWWKLLLTFLSNCAILAICWFILKHIIIYIMKLLENRDDYTKISFLLSFVLGFAYLSYVLGLSQELGAMIAGMTISTSAYAFKIEQYISTLKSFLLSCFFLSIGSSIDWIFIKTNYKSILIISAIIVAAKSIVSVISTKSHGKRILLFANPSEMSIMILPYFVRLGIIDQRTHDLIFSSVILLLLIFSVIIRLCGKFIKFDSERNFDFVIFGGFPVGATTANLLQKEGFSSIVINSNMDENVQIKSQYSHVQFGSMKSQMTLHKIYKTYKPKAVVICRFSSNEALISLIIKCKNNNIDVFVVTRICSVSQICKKYGATVIDFNPTILVQHVVQTIMSNINTLFINRQ